VRLATAARLNRDLGKRKSLPVMLIPYPSPSGDTVAVTVQPQGAANMGIVFLNRAGRVLGLVPASADPADGPAWSPSGATMAVPVLHGATADLTIWTVSGRIRTRAVPAGRWLLRLPVVTGREADTLRRQPEQEPRRRQQALGDRERRGRRHVPDQRPRHASSLAALIGDGQAQMQFLAAIRVWRWPCPTFLTLTEILEREADPG
jgi:hypothetical protein